ncbi:hypothetical protein [Microbacterium amylolyticum]|uniref:PQQ-like domain-containing protein n=1 Tax=Microbacterium amylolyticum TaxID=936337 RepID=A0ABS4ZF47_9MICO|nr:hypothetical protein [Microbacterium amylolyticum]MBP2435910.1 hypothetical protein [Microbacterium amylolyticum]
MGAVRGRVLLGIGVVVLTMSAASCAEAPSSGLPDPTVAPRATLSSEATPDTPRFSGDALPDLVLEEIPVPEGSIVNRVIRATISGDVLVVAGSDDRGRRTVEAIDVSDDVDDDEPLPPPLPSAEVTPDSVLPDGVLWQRRSAFEPVILTDESVGSFFSADGWLANTAIGGVHVERFYAVPCEIETTPGIEVAWCDEDDIFHTRALGIVGIDAQDLNTVLWENTPIPSVEKDDPAAESLLAATLDVVDVARGTVLLNVQSGGIRTVAVAADDGETRWEADGASAVRIAGEVVIATREGELVGLDLETGDERWVLDGHDTWHATGRSSLALAQHREGASLIDATDGRVLSHLPGAALLGTDVSMWLGRDGALMSVGTDGNAVPAPEPTDDAVLSAVAGSYGWLETDDGHFFATDRTGHPRTIPMPGTDLVVSNHLVIAHDDAGFRAWRVG